MIQDQDMHVGRKFQVENLLKEKKHFKSLKEIIVFDELEYKDPVVSSFQKALEIAEKTSTSRKSTGAEKDRPRRNCNPDLHLRTRKPKGVMLTHNTWCPTLTVH